MPRDRGAQGDAGYAGRPVKPTGQTNWSNQLVKPINQSKEGEGSTQAVLRHGNGDGRHSVKKSTGHKSTGQTNCSNQLVNLVKRRRANIYIYISGQHGWSGGTASAKPGNWSNRLVRSNSGQTKRSNSGPISGKKTAVKRHWWARAPDVKQRPNKWPR